MWGQYTVQDGALQEGSVGGTLQFQWLVAVGIGASHSSKEKVQWLKVF